MLIPPTLKLKCRDFHSNDVYEIEFYPFSVLKLGGLGNINRTLLSPIST